MATVAVVLKTTKKLSNDEYAVAIRATHERDSRYYPFSTLVTNQSLPWRCKREDWKAPEEEDEGLGKFRKIFPTYKESNEILKLKLSCFFYLRYLLKNMLYFLTYPNFRLLAKYTVLTVTGAPWKNQYGEGFSISKTATPVAWFGFGLSTINDVAAFWSYRRSGNTPGPNRIS